MYTGCILWQKNQPDKQSCYWWNHQNPVGNHFVSGIILQPKLIDNNNSTANVGQIEIPTEQTRDKGKSSAKCRVEPKQRRQNDETQNWKVTWTYNWNKGGGFRREWVGAQV